MKPMTIRAVVTNRPCPWRLTNIGGVLRTRNHRELADLVPDVCGYARRLLAGLDVGESRKVIIEIREEL